MMTFLLGQFSEQFQSILGLTFEGLKILQCAYVLFPKVKAFVSNHELTGKNVIRGEKMGVIK